MSALADPRFTEQEWAAKMRAEREVRDKSYRRFPLGQEVGHFLRAKRLERCRPNTLQSYETTLCAFVLDFRDVETLDHFVSPGGADELTEFLYERWGEAKESTLDNRTGAINSLFSWAWDTRRISHPVKVRRRRARGAPIRVAHELAEIQLIVAAQERVQDELAILLMGRLGFRKDDVRLFQARDVDFPRDVVFIRDGKGGKPVVCEVVFNDVREALMLWLSEPEVANPLNYLLAPRGNPQKAYDPSSMHRWWERCLERARVGHFPMHELRHSAIDRFYRKTKDLELTRKFARHESADTTKAYLHLDSGDMRAAMRLVE